MNKKQEKKGNMVTFWIYSYSVYSLGYFLFSIVMGTLIMFDWIHFKSIDNSIIVLFILGILFSIFYGMKTKRLINANE